MKTRRQKTTKNKTRKTTRKTTRNTTRKTTRNTKQILLNAFEGLSGYGYSTENVTNNLVVPTYGELTMDGYQRMVRGIKTTNSHFYDLGSGIGKIVFYGALLSKFKSSTGVEIIRERAKMSNTIKHRLLYGQNKQKLTKYQKERINAINLLNASMFNKRFFTNDDPCVYFLSSLCFTEEMKKRLANYFNKYRRNKKTHIFTSKQLDINVHSKFTSFPVEMTWSQSSELFHYYIPEK